MKRLICLLLASLFISMLVSTASAQNTGTKEDFKFTVKTNPLSALGGPFWLIVVPLTGEYKVLFETVISEKSSLQLGVGYIGPSVLLNLDDLSSEEGEISGIKTSGFRGQAMFKYFISRDLSAPEGFYVGPHVSYATAELKNKMDATESLKGTKINVNGIFGYQLITSGGFTLDIFTGLGFVSRKWEMLGTTWNEEETAFQDKASVNVPFGLSFGYAF